MGYGEFVETRVDEALQEGHAAGMDLKAAIHAAFAKLLNFVLSIFGYGYELY